jgi:hypothetical protein
MSVRRTLSSWRWSVFLRATSVLFFTASAVFVTIAVAGPTKALPPPEYTKTIPVPAVAIGEVGLVRSTPVFLDIPTLNVALGLGKLGLNADGTVQVPTNTTTAGWYEYGPTPGQIGSAVILGHVDSYVGPGIFFDLRELKAGDRIIVRLADHATVRFEVLSVAEFSKTNFPSQRVYGSHGYSALQLVTCGGVFDEATGHYESNIVVFAARV